MENACCGCIYVVTDKITLFFWVIQFDGFGSYHGAFFRRKYVYLNIFRMKMLEV